MQSSQKPTSKKGADAVGPSPGEQKRASAPHLPAQKQGFYRLIRFIAWILLWPFFRLEVNGVQHLPRNSAFILLVKHQRWEDIPLVAIATPLPLYYIAKYELFQKRLGSWFFTALGGIPLNRQRPLESRRFLQSAIALLKKGEGIVIFPEGTYYPERMGPGQAGMIKFVQSRLNLPFIPVGIRYIRDSRRTRVRINFGKAVHAGPTQAANALLERMMAEIAALSKLPIH